MFVPFNLIDENVFPNPSTIILAALAEFRRSDKTDFEIACCITEYLSVILEKNNFIITASENLDREVHPTLFVLKFIRKPQGR